MNENISHFPHALKHPKLERRKSTLPHWAQPDDEFELIEVQEALADGAIQPGALLTILKGHEIDGAPHAVEFEGEIYIGTFYHTATDAVRFESWHGGHRSGTYPLDGLNVLGYVCRVWMPHPEVVWVLETHHRLAAKRGLGRSALTVAG